MIGFLVDTNCISELIRPRPEPSVVHWMQAADERMLYLSVLSLGEIRKGIALLPDSKRARLDTWVELELKSRFAGRILPISVEIADEWGLLAARARSSGRTLPIIDGLLAATAVHHDLTIVTRNTADFIGTNVSVLSPWPV